MPPRTPLLFATCFAVACSSNAGSPDRLTPDAGSAVSLDAGEPATSHDAAPSASEAAPETMNVHGTVVDVESLAAVQGLTIRGGGVSATTDANGHWSLAIPPGSMLQASLTGPDYSQVLFPDLVPLESDVDLGTTVIPDMSTYQLEQAILSNFDSTKSLVHILVLTGPTCASAVGGTITVTSPSDALVAYFGTNPVPSSSITSFQQVAEGRPVADVYNVDPGATLALSISHPTCKQVPFPATYGSRQYTGTVQRMPAQPGGLSSALAFILE